MTASTTSPALRTYYDGYFADPREEEWYNVCALAKADNAMQMCAELPHATLLDIGAGNGSVLQNIAQRGFAREYYALEISAGGLKSIQAKNIPGLVECRAFDGYHIPYPDNRFDVAVLSHVVEHVEHPRMLLTEAARVARHVYVEVPLELTLFNRGLRRDWVLDSTGHINYYNRHLIRLLVQTCGLRVLREGVHNAAARAYAFQGGKKALIRHALKSSLLRVAPSLATFIWSYHYGLVCTRHGSPVVTAIAPGGAARHTTIPFDSSEP
jgi:ubiquinone/menaquinone biosynthesis C-methylase UbiE